MPKLTIELWMDNDAFLGQQGAEVARILTSYANSCRLGGSAHSVSLRDANGNTIGSAQVNPTEGDDK
jgi:hypothetical protein